MSKKRLNPQSLINELRGESSFFPVKETPIEYSPLQPVTEEPEKIDEAKQSQGKNKEVANDGTMIPWYHGTMQPLYHNNASSLPDDELIEFIRKAVKQLGKEPATQRLTLEEKRELKAIEFTYSQQEINTSGNEIIRIAMNYIFQDYKKNGENSILAKVLTKLNS